MIYRVTYSSMSASYGPTYVEAENEYEAKRKFGGTAFRREEYALMTARPVSSREIERALSKADE